MSEVLEGIMVVLTTLIGGSIIIENVLKLGKCTCKSQCDCEGRFRKYSNAYFKIREAKLSVFLNAVLSAAVIATLVGFLYAHRRSASTSIYEKTDGISVTTINIFGAANAYQTNSKGTKRVWDAADIAVPAAAADSAFFLTTQIVTTREQKREICTGPTANCTNDADCDPDKRSFSSRWGLSNGTCDSSVGRCEVHAWCPIEDGVQFQRGIIPPNTTVEVLDGIKDFNILIRSYAHFEFKDGTINDKINIFTDHLHNADDTHCLNDDDHKLCPYFKIGDILKKTNVTLKDDEIKDGAVISIRIKWRCYQEDESEVKEEDQCAPEYDFVRLDKEKWKATGFNFTDTVHSYYDKDARHHTRSIGILFVVEVDGEAFKRSTVQVIMMLGSAIGCGSGVNNLMSYILMIVAVFYAGCNEETQV